MKMYSAVRIYRPFLSHHCGFSGIKKHESYGLSTGRYQTSRTASLVMSSFFSSLHALIGWYPILLCHGKIKHAFSATSHLGNPFDHHSSAIDSRPIPEAKQFLMIIQYGAWQRIYLLLFCNN